MPKTLWNNLSIWERATALLSLLRDSLGRLLSSILGTSSPTTTTPCDSGKPPRPTTTTPCDSGKPPTHPVKQPRGMQIIPVYWDPQQNRFRREDGARRIELTKVGVGLGSEVYPASGAT